MSLWEYKVITSGKGGFATPALLEKFLNDLGRDEWEIVHFHTPPDNFLAFTGLARRTTQRDWTLEDAAAAAAKAEAEKLRAEFEAKFKAASSPAPAEERAPSFLEEKAAPDDGFRKPVDTSHDDEPEAAEEDKDDWDKLTEEDELPTFFEAIKPHMRRNQRGPGMSVGVDYLAKKWDQSEEDLKGALVECGFVMPADEDSKAEYVEYDGDLYWLNINRRGELWINTKEKPRPVFRPVKAQKIVVEDEAPKPENRTQRQDDRAPKQDSDRGQKPDSDRGQRQEGERAPVADSENRGSEAVSGGSGGETPAQGNRAENGRPSVPLPEGTALLEKIRPHMRRNRRGPGGSGSTTFLSRALRTNEGELKNAFAALGLALPSTPSDKPVFTEFGNELWWLNLDSRGGLWINGRDKKPGETLAAANEASVAGTSEQSGGADSSSASPAPAESSPASAAPDGVPAPEVAPSVAASAMHDNASSTSSHAAEAPLGSAAASADQASAENARSGRDVAPSTSAAESARGSSEANSPASNNPILAGVRVLLKETRTGSMSGKIDRLAEELGKSADDFIATLVGAGLKVPEKPREKPVYAEHAGEILWLNKNAKGELWLNAKASKFADKDDRDDKADESDEGAASEGGEGEKADGDKADGDKPRRSRLSRGRSRTE